MTEIGNPAFFNEQEEKMIMMATTHLFSPSPKLKCFKEVIGKCKLIYFGDHDHIKKSEGKEQLQTVL